jgi:hypothetical protein
MTENERDKKSINYWLRMRDGAHAQLLDQNFKKGGDETKDFGKFLKDQPKPAEPEKPAQTIEDLSDGAASIDDY